MNGEVIYFDAERGTGFIAGRDGNRYVFDRADIVGAERLAKGAAVDFTIDEDRARAVAPLVQRGSRVLERQAAAPSAGSVPSVSGSLAEVDGAGFQGDMQDDGDGLGLFAYFRRCVTTNYAGFSGRARRKEFWAFALFSVIVVTIIALAGIALDFAAGNMKQIASDADFSAGGGPWITAVLAGFSWLALIIPSIAVTVRRIHDIGLSGWFWFLTFVPSVGSLIILVFTLIPSQRHPNKWGPIPAGVARD
ncbi:MAG: DUF805 domain-containing protein [Rhizobiaceae bacterium]|nr:DUF805 domain-containing protein [Rhizobiaceae bacterium]